MMICCRKWICYRAWITKQRGVKSEDHIVPALLPMNLPCTMTPEMAAAARSFNPRILYPYHFGETDTRKIVDLLKDSGIEVRIRNMK